MPPTTGAELSERFYRELVGPLVRAEFPELRHAAGRWGSGSDVLGLDDATSRDHDWGCRLTLLVDDAHAAVVPELDRRLEERLPDRFAGFPVRFAMTWDQRVRHKIWTDTVTGFASSRLGVDAGAMTAADWLLVTGQSVLEVTAGAVFADLPALVALRERLAWYPDQVWRYVLAAGWERIGASLPMFYRTAQRGDLLGPRLLAADAVGDLIHLAYLLERRWEPYRKWSGLVFARLPVATELGPPLRAALTAGDPERAAAPLLEAVEILLVRQRGHGLPTPDTGVEAFHGRPARTVGPDVAGLLRASVTDPELAALPADLGSVEQWVRHHEVLSRPERRAALRSAY